MMEKIGIIKRIKGRLGSSFCEMELENDGIVYTEQYGVREMMNIAGVDSPRDLYGIKVVCHVSETTNFMKSFNFVDAVGKLV